MRGYVLVALMLLAAGAPAAVRAQNMAQMDEGDVVTADSTRLHYFAYGSGADTLIIPMAALLEPELRRLASRHRLIFYDPRGRGLSDPVSSDRKAAFAACEWLIRELKRTVPIWKKEVYSDGEEWIEGDAGSDQATST